jgi:3-dehydroquinate dehydratase-2
MHRILVLHGPNLSALGTREPETYGRVTLAEIDRRLRDLAAELRCEVECIQSNHEGVLIDALHGARDRSQGVVLNPAGLTHGSVVLRDAVLAAGLPVVEVHLTNPHRREAFRQRSLISSAALGVIEGFGPDSYTLALRALAGHLADRSRG